VAVPFTKLTTFPRNRLIDEDLVRCRARELDLLTAFGPPSHETPAGEPDPTFFWDLEWRCGLVMGIQFEQLSEQVVLRLDEPEFDHALRHLGVEVRDVWTLEAADPRRFATLGDAGSERWALWREDRNQLKELVVASLLHRDAECRLAEVDGSDPQHRYWIAPDDSA
jgi:hypothetical protein